MKIDAGKLVEKFNALDLKLRYGILGIAVVWIMLLDYALIMQFQVRALSKMKQEIATLKADTDRVKNESQRITQIMRNASGMQGQVQKFNTKIRSLQEVPLVLDEISRIANTNKVTIDQITPAKEGQEEMVTIGSIKYYALPIVITARSGYHMFGRLLNELENAQLLFIVKDLRIQPSEKPNSLAVGVTLKVILMDKKEGPQA